VQAARSVRPTSRGVPIRRCAAPIRRPPRWHEPSARCGPCEKLDATIVTKLAAQSPTMLNPTPLQPTPICPPPRLHLGQQDPIACHGLKRRGCSTPRPARLRAIEAAVPARSSPTQALARSRAPDMTAPLAQRCHDSLKLGLQTAIASGSSCSHRGHPVTVVVTTTVADLTRPAHAGIDDRSDAGSNAHRRWGQVADARS